MRGPLNRAIVQPLKLNIVQFTWVKTRDALRTVARKTANLTLCLALSCVCAASGTSSVMTRTPSNGSALTTQSGPPLREPRIKPLEEKAGRRSSVICWLRSGGTRLCPEYLQDIARHPKLFTPALISALHSAGVNTTGSRQRNTHCRIAWLSGVEYEWSRIPGSLWRTA